MQSSEDLLYPGAHILGIPGIHMGLRIAGIPAVLIQFDIIGPKC